LTTFLPDQRLSILIHAGSKLGKSTLSATAPKPVLVLDVEGSWRFIPVRKVYWDPARYAPPLCDGTWDACIVTVSDWDTVKLVYDWLTMRETCFTSVVIDSVSELQRRCKANLKGTEALKIQDWGVLLAVMDAVIRGFRDLTLKPNSNVRCVVFVAETKMNGEGKLVPYMQGQIAGSMPYWVDIITAMWADYELDGNGQPTREVRRLVTRPNPTYEAGERVQGRIPPLITFEKPDVGAVGRDIEVWMEEIFSVPLT
jgi:AAA domain